MAMPLASQDWALLPVCLLPLPMPGCCASAQGVALNLGHVGCLNQTRLDGVQSSSTAIKGGYSSGTDGAKGSRQQNIPQVPSPPPGNHPHHHTVKCKHKTCWRLALLLRRCSVKLTNTW